MITLDTIQAFVLIALPLVLVTICSITGKGEF